MKSRGCISVCRAHLVVPSPGYIKLKGVRDRAYPDKMRKKKKKKKNELPRRFFLFLQNHKTLTESVQRKSRMDNAAITAREKEKKHFKIECVSEKKSVCRVTLEVQCIFSISNLTCCRVIYS